MRKLCLPWNPNKLHGTVHSPLKRLHFQPAAAKGQEQVCRLPCKQSASCILTSYFCTPCCSHTTGTSFQLLLLEVSPDSLAEGRAVGQQPGPCHAGSHLIVACQQPPCDLQAEHHHAVLQTRMVDETALSAKGRVLPG